MGIFYHVSSIKLDKGTILEPRYGDTINTHRYFRDTYSRFSQYLKESIFEDVRTNKFSSSPSRVKSIYLWQDLENAMKYKNKYNKSFIYEVVLEEPNLAKEFDMSWMDLTDFQYYDSIKKIADYYYSGKSVNEGSVNWGFYEDSGAKLEPIWETLYEGKATVKRLVSGKNCRYHF
ncbi:MULTISPECIES: DUF2441 domain-containing protein [Bacillus]|uniref:DUF2441 domain-containing protein n=1 Tax=Bacillus TaxID=1386 RepID=UPI000468B07B|nr:MULTISPECIES: hypothetical protein [Bacillus]MED1408585.1 DUF2441 domain-containing protein [Bacillus paramycoides]MED1465554.1 DUF2441 domain-containing protein [Bacillus paramycoides]MED1495734.1 DUF2441 domain-containing protein [Bacillus paramycoides]